MFIMCMQEDNGQLVSGDTIFEDCWKFKDCQKFNLKRMFCG